MQKIEIQLLNALLDRYEHSRGFVEDRRQQRRILLRMYGQQKTDFPLYDIEDSAARRAVNEAAERLRRLEVADPEWMRGQEGHILSRIALRPGAEEIAYRLCGREPLADTVRRLARRLGRAREAAAAPWAERYLADQLAFLAQNRRPAAAFPSDPAEQEAWLAVLEALSRLSPERPVLERVFSLRCLGDSKAFARTHRARLLRVLRQYLPLDTEEMTEEDLLRQAGLERYPEWFALWGELRFQWPDGRVLDAGPLADGLRISADDARTAELSVPAGTQALLFVENKANYYALIRERPANGWIVVFHGGCYSPQRGQFFRRLCRAAGPRTRLLHWGDIDLGGFSMNSRLRREIDPRIRPWCMDRARLLAHRSETAPFSRDYAAKLARLLEDPVLEDCRDTLRYMLEEGVRLEQEALIDDPACRP